MLFLACLLRGHVGNGAYVAVTAAVGSVNAHELGYFQSEDLGRGPYQVFQPIDSIENKCRILSLDFSISSTRGLVEKDAPTSHLRPILSYNTRYFSPCGK